MCAAMRSHTVLPLMLIICVVHHTYCDMFTGVQGPKMSWGMALGFHTRAGNSGA